MAIKLVKQESGIYDNELINTFIIDGAEDVADLPKSSPGSIAVVADTSKKVFMVNASGEWKEI